MQVRHQNTVIYMLIHILLLNGKVKSYVRCIPLFMKYQQVFVGFIIALIQIISQKSEIISLKSNLRKSQNELDNLRNQSLDEDVPLFDEITDEEDI